MKRIKIIALFFSISVVFSGYFLSAQAGIDPASSVKFGQTGQDIYSYQQKNDYSGLFNSLFALINSLKEQIVKLQNSINTKSNLDSLKNTASTSSQSKSFVSAVKKENAIFTVDGYYEKFTNDVAKNISFSKEETALMKKGEESGGKRILRLEELMRKAVEGHSLGDLKDSFSAWHNFDERVILKMKKLPVSGKALLLNEDLIGWFKFHSAAAKKLAENDLTKDEISGLYNQFKSRAASQNLLMKNSTAQIGNYRDFSLVNSAQALTCTPTGNNYFFGGSISNVYYCNDGTAITIKTPCGGTFFLSYAVEALNPYFTGFLKANDNTLGKATISAGTCMLGEVEQTVYEANIVYYGASGGL